MEFIAGQICEGDVLIKVSMADEYVVAFLDILHL